MKELLLLVRDFAQVCESSPPPSCQAPPTPFCRIFLSYQTTQLVGERVEEGELCESLKQLMSEYDINRDGRLELEELSHLMSVEDNFMKTFCVSLFVCLFVCSVSYPIQ